MGKRRNRLSDVHGMLVGKELGADSVVNSILLHRDYVGAVKTEKCDASFLYILSFEN